MKYFKLFIIISFVFLLYSCKKPPKPINTQVYSVKLLYEDGKVEETKYLYANTIIRLPALSKVGHNFIGWFLNEDQKTKQIREGHSVKYNMELVPKFEPIKYKINLLFPTDQRSTIYTKYNEKIDLPEQMKKEGYEVVLTNRDNGRLFDLNDVVVSDLYFVVNYRALDLKKEVCKVNINFNNDEPNLLFYVYKGDKIVLPQIKKEDYSFDTYFDTITNRNVSLITAVDEDMELVAKYTEIIHTIRFQSTSYGGQYINNIYIKHNHTIKDMPIFQKPRTRFLYWEDQIGNKIDEFTPVSSDLVLRPIFEYLATNKDYLKYEIKNDEVTILGLHNQNIKDLVIPSVIDGYPVSKIQAYAFANNDELQYALIPESVVDIGDGIFYNCRSLTKATLPNTLKTIPKQMFMESRLNHVNLPHDLEHIEDEAFFNTSLYDVVFPLKLKTIGDYAFYQNRFTSLIFPTNLETIGRHAFRKNNSIAKILFNNNLKTIKEFAFADCDTIREVGLPYSLTYLGRYAFAHCYYLREFTIYDVIENIAINHFDDYSPLSIINVIKTKDTFPWEKYWNRNSIKDQEKIYDYRWE